MPPDSDADLAILRLAWRLDALDQWRKEIEQRVAGNSRELERLVKADEIADAVAAKLGEAQSERLTEGSFRLTKMQTWAAIVSVGVAGVGVILSALAQAGIL